ncbi:hypothetical protein [Trichocoleus sp. FACHB-262]|uniref:hypothetical protein n=1 Tax=Trichocoleus sp. FACHB-262 TaxID=2692869 RepID=UPI001685EC31|nr:hypothetical protein [Trichocoleus sp. FACHB-262]MBD2124021.1 hypothetical protein [Trichocoleus sp. FACHB-262]
MKTVEQTATKLVLRHRPTQVWRLAAGIAIVLPVLLLWLSTGNSWLNYLWWFPLFVVFWFGCGALLFIVAGQAITYELDKTAHKLTVRHHRLPKTQTTEVDLKDIVDVQLQLSSWQHDSNAIYQGVLLLRGDRVLTLHCGFNASRQDKEAIVTVIRQFLGMQP